MRRFISIVMVCVFIVVTLSGCSLLQKLGLQNGSEDELRPVSSIIIGEDEAKELTNKVPIHLYFANEDNTKLKLEVRYIPIADAKQGTSHLASLIVRELINGPSADTGYKATIPVGTKLRTPVSISSRIATVDLSKEFKTKHSGGKDAEKMTIYSIVNSLTELTDIQKVKFTIAGKVEKEYMGSYQFNAPFPRTTSLISKDTEKATGIEPADGSKETSGDSGNGALDGLEMLE
jgi:germination protein M